MLATNTNACRIQVLHLARDRKVDRDAAFGTQRARRLTCGNHLSDRLAAVAWRTHPQRVPGASQELAALRARVQEELLLLMQYTGPPAAPLDALPMFLERKLRAFLDSAPLQDPRVARFRAYLIQNYIGDPAHVTNPAAAGVRSPPYPATKWAHVSGDGAV